MKDINFKGKRVAVIGSRTFVDKERLFKILDINKNNIKMIVSGGATGADTFAQEWAKERGFPCLIFYPKWKTEDGKHDRGAGFRRNYNIIESSDIVVAFWDKISGGTKNSITLAQQLKKPIRIFEFTPTEPEKEKLEPPVEPPKEDIKAIEQAAKEVAESNGEALLKAAGVEEGKHKCQFGPETAF